VRVAPEVKRVIAIDFAANMIERLSARLSAEGISNVEPHVMNALRLEFDNARFDIVVSMFGWFLFDDRAGGLAEMKRVIRPGGRLLVSSWAAPDKNLMLALAMEALRTAVPDLPRPKYAPATQDPETCVQEVAAAGFVDVAFEYVSADLEFDSARAYWDLFEKGGAPIALLKRKLGEEAWQAASARALEFLEQKLGSGSVKLSAAAIFTTARAPKS
jgi:SAM-dependent methyltransferase